MDKKEKTGKKLPTKLIVVIGVALIAVLAVIFFLGPKEEAYRQVQVYEVDGTADVEREQVGLLEAYANMMLQNQDIVNVSEDSNMKVKLDEDKYILLEPKTKIHLEATGTSEDSKTKIFLEEGAIVCNIENPLSENSTYEVNTPNSTMAVRGTTFRVSLEYDEEGNSYTVAAVFDGKVESFLILPDGTVDDEGFIIEKGTQVQIKGTEEDTVYIVTNEDIPYEVYEKVTLQFLEIILEKGEDISIDEETLKELIVQAIEKETVEDTENSEEIENTEETSTESTEVEESSTQSTKKVESSVTKDEEIADDDIENEEPEDNITQPEKETETETETQVESETYTVTFSYNGETFATQDVENGNCAVEPKLMPAATGSWDFDFTEVITADTTIEWIE